MPATPKVEPSSNEEESEYLYHVTTYRRLETIADTGLLRGRARAIGAPSHDHHAAKGIFLTEAGGVFFWHSRAEDHANHGSDDVLEDEVVPVVLRVHPDSIPDEEYEQDAEGTRDALSDAWIVQGPIDAEDIDVFDGKDWIPIEAWESIDPMLGVVKVDVDDDGEPIYGFPHDSGLFPPELHP